MEMTKEQLELITNQLATIKERSPFYAKKFEGVDVTDVRTQADFEKLPFSEKDDLRAVYPLGLQAVPDEEVVRIHSSSGTTGTPVIIPYTQQDVIDWATQFARCYEMAGITPLDRIQITPGYGLWTAGIGFQLGAERLGAMAIPMGPGNTEKQLKMMQDLKSTVICATSSYALLLAEEINKRFGTHCIALRCDVSDPNSVSTMMAEVLRAYGEVNFVHSNAGIISPDDNGDMPLESWNRMLGVNLTGMMLVDQAAAHQMKAQGKGGAVVNTASMSAHIVNEAHGEGARHSIGYTATKAGVLHLTKSFAMDFCRDHIRFNSISPGYMLSGIHDNIPQSYLDEIAKDTPRQRFGTMDEIGGLVAFLLSDLATFITGSDVLVDGGHCVW